MMMKKETLIKMIVYALVFDIISTLLGLTIMYFKG